MYKHTYIHIHICYQENNVSSQLSPQWICGNFNNFADRSSIEGLLICIGMYVRTKGTSCTSNRHTGETFLQMLLSNICEQLLLRQSINNV